MDAQGLLDAYVTTRGDEYREPLSDAVRELVHRSVGRREVSDLEDFEEECVLAIWTKISSLASDDSLGAIDNLEAFVRRAVHNRYCDAIRRKRPAWYNIKLELLELFSGKANVEGFALWQSPATGARLCGFAEWEGAPESGSARCREVVDNTRSFAAKHLNNRDPAEAPMWELAAAVLDYCGGPVDVDALTTCIAEITHAHVPEPLSIDAQPDADEDCGPPVDWLISPDTDVAKQVTDAGWFEHVMEWFWKEFLQLSTKQRKALLYGLTGDQVMAICSAVGMREVAESLEMDAARLASLVGDLPLPDAVTADELGVEPRAVPSVRFKAWGRIRRRTKRSSLSLDDERATA